MKNFQVSFPRYFSYNANSFSKISLYPVVSALFFPYDPHEEIIKVWPTELNTKMPVMIEKETNLIQRFELTGIRKLDQGKYLAEGITSISGSQGETYKI